MKSWQCDAQFLTLRVPFLWPVPGSLPQPLLRASAAMWCVHCHQGPASTAPLPPKRERAKTRGPICWGRSSKWLLLTSKAEAKQSTACVSLIREKLSLGFVTILFQRVRLSWFIISSIEGRFFNRDAQKLKEE